MREQLLEMFKQTIAFKIHDKEDNDITVEQSEITFDCCGGGEWNGVVNQDDSKKYWIWEVDVERNYASLTVKEYEDFLSNGTQTDVAHTEEIKDFLNNVKHYIHSL